MENSYTKVDASTKSDYSSKMQSSNKVDSTTKEDATTKMIESRTKNIPSDAFLFTALGALAFSLTLKIMGRSKDASFVGQWVAPILIMGVYNKIVKQEESK
ncbi:hypothetical protein BH11BAC2_BH11BAC2_14190 [soil metagenome]